MNFFYSASTDPALNLACEELFARKASAPLFMLWRNAPSIIIGRNQNTWAEINQEFVNQHHIQVIRRITGGGAVYHDLGNINYSCVTQERIWSAESAAKFTAPILQALQQLGVHAEYSGRNDILANGRKISGCARSIPDNHTLFHGTLLFNTELDILTQALNPDPEKIRSKGIKSVRARVGNIQEMLPPEHAGLSMDDFIQHLICSITAFYGTAPVPPPDEIWQEAKNLAERKYRTWEWNFGTNLTYEVHKKIYFQGGTIQAEFNVEHNRISTLRFTGDFFGARPITDITEKMIGQFPRKENLLPIINTLPLQEYIAGISSEELASLLSLQESNTTEKVL